MYYISECCINTLTFTFTFFRISTLGPGGLLVYACQLSAYSETNISDEHRGFDSVLFNLGLLANAEFTDAQHVAAQTTHNIWCPAVCTSQSLMALLTHAAKWDPGAHGARCARTSSSSSSRMRVMNHNWSTTKQRLHPQSVAEISRHSVWSGDRIRQCGTSSGFRHKDTDQCL